MVTTQALAPESHGHRNPAKRRVHGAQKSRMQTELTMHKPQRTDFHIFYFLNTDLAIVIYNIKS